MGGGGKESWSAYRKLWCVSAIMKFLAHIRAGQGVFPGSGGVFLLLTPYTFCAQLRLSIVIYYAITKSSATVISRNLNLVFVCDSINHSIRKFVFGQRISNDNFS
jgi:hypothetical protein